MVGNIFLDISLLFAITVSIAFLVRFLRQPLMIAYIVAGIIAGPVFLNLTHGGEEFFKAFAEMGVVLLLFVVGLSLNFTYLKRVGAVVIMAGIGQFVATSGLGFLLIHYVLGFPVASALYLSIAITFSSTIIVVKLLSDKNDLETVYGRYTIGLLLVQDIIAIVIMLFMTTFLKENTSLTASLGDMASKGFALAAIIYFLSRLVLPVFLKRVAETSDFLFIFTIAWCFGVASLVYGFGFSLEIGAVVAGISLGSSPYQFQIMSKIKPLRDFFIVLFFIILGSEMTLGQVGTLFVPFLVISLFILIAQPIILFVLFRLMKFTRRNSMLVGITAAQVSEFGFILLFTGQTLGLGLGKELAVLTMVALFTIFVSSYLITYNEQLYRLVKPFFKMWGPDNIQQEEKKMQAIYDVWVVGYHRLGWKICEALKEKNVSFAVIDHNPEAIKKLKNRSIPAYFGDVADVEFLDLLALEKARLIIATIPAADDQITFFKHVRAHSQKTLLIGHLQHSRFIDDLYAAGADYVVLPHLLIGQWFSGLLRSHAWTKHTFQKLALDQKKELRLHYTLPAV
ncbi:MAG TPA: hypothetical protein DDW36_02120 [Candidatus Magasanikbacteria bacterium]|nr:hypothetical protein [Candidatus Magasanikbacteria bacterium]